MRIVEDIKQEYFGFMCSSLSSFFAFASMIACFSVGNATATIFGLGLLAGYVLLVIAAVKNRMAVERDLKKYIQMMLDKKLKEKGIADTCKVVRAQSYILRYYIYLSEHITKQDVEDVMDECYTQTKIRMRYRYVKCKEDEFINNLFV